MARMILGCILITIAALVIYALWQITHSRGSQKRQPSKRHSIGSDQKRVIKQARILWEQGDIHGSVGLLSSINMHIEAATLLESKGQTLDAGMLLLRSGYQQRGATLLEKNEHWKEATRAYKELGLYIKEAQCAENAGLYTESALAFAAGQAHLEAGICFMKAQQPAQAAASFLIAGETLHWLEAIKYLSEHAPDQYQINRLEFSWFLQLVNEITQHHKLLQMLDNQGMLVPLILHRLGQQDFDIASKLFQNHKQRKSELISKVDYDSVAAETLSKVLLWSGEYESAGILYHQRSEFEKAASAFKQSGNEKRYLECQRLAQGFTPDEEQSFALSSLSGGAASPAQSSPAQSSPAQSSPAQSSPAQSSPAPTPEQSPPANIEPPPDEQTIIVKLDLDNEN